MYKEKCTLRVETLSGSVDQTYEYNDKIKMIKDYSRYLNQLKHNKFDIPEDEVYIFKSPEDTMVAYKNVFGEIDYITTQLFYRRFNVNKELCEKVKSLTGE